jgi:hypothetical protein
MKKLFAALFLLLAFAFNALASTVNFADTAVDQIQQGPFTSGELTFTPGSVGNYYTLTPGLQSKYFIVTPPPGSHNGTNALLAGEGHYHYSTGHDFNYGGAFSFKETNNSIFSLASLDAGTPFGSSRAGSVVFTGHQVGGGTLTQMLSLNNPYAHYVLGWSNLVSVEVSENSNFGYVAYDNISVNAAPGVNTVPVPAAVWLFGSALIGLVGSGKRKQRRG